MCSGCKPAKFKGHSLLQLCLAPNQMLFIGSGILTCRARALSLLALCIFKISWACLYVLVLNDRYFMSACSLLCSLVLFIYIYLLFDHCLVLLWEIGGKLLMGILPTDVSFLSCLFCIYYTYMSKCCSFLFFTVSCCVLAHLSVEFWKT